MSDKEFIDRIIKAVQEIGPDNVIRVWHNRGPFMGLHMTDREREHITRVWDGLPGNTCFMDALMHCYWYSVGPDIYNVWVSGKLNQTGLGNIIDDRIRQALRRA